MEHGHMYALCSSCGKDARFSCNGCKRMISRDCKFCPSCGKQRDLKYCASCKNEISIGDKFCCTCGVPVDELMRSGNGQLDNEDIKDGSLTNAHAGPSQVRAKKIALIGESGTGKSSFINAVMGLDGDDDNAAPVGPTITTTATQRYQPPDHTDLELWDHPGFKFVSRSEYLSEYLTSVGIEGFDIVILTFHSRVKKTDIGLAKHILKLKKQVFFVRTMIDIEISKDKNVTNKSHDPAKVLEHIRNDAIKQVKDANIHDPQIFLIDNYSPNKFDFDWLIQRLLS